jgi:hypothetical protein
VSQFECPAQRGLSVLCVSALNPTVNVLTAEAQRALELTQRVETETLPARVQEFSLNKAPMLAVSVLRQRRRSPPR